MLIDKLTKKSKVDGQDEEPKIHFRANKHQFQAKYFTTYGDYLIFMFNAVSENKIEF
jgi:hypothetical protein